MSSRIAVVIDPWAYPYNGTVVSTRRFVSALEREGFEFELLAISGDWAEGGRRGCAFSQLSIPGVNRIIDRMRAPLAKPDRARVRAALAGCSVLHVQYPFFLGAVAISEARKLDIPVICSFHVQPENILDNLGLSSPTLSRWLYRLFVRVFYNRADRVVAPSRFAADLLREHGVIRPITVLSNGVPEEFFDAPAAPGPVGRFRLLSVGRLAREKQHATLIRAVAASAHRDRIDLTVGGVGPQEQALRALADGLGLRVSIGWLAGDQLLGHYAAADLVVHAGTAELEGMSVLEAMAAGNAVIVADSSDSACAHFVTDPRARFKTGDAVDLAEKIDYWLEHREARLAHGEANRRFAASLSHARSASQLAALYRAVQGEAPGPAARGPRLSEQ